MSDAAFLQQIFETAEDANAAPMELHLISPNQALAAAPDFADLIRLWLERRGDAEVPDWRDVDFPDFRGWHASLILGQFVDDEPDPVMRIAGQDYVDIARNNPKGARFSHVLPRLYRLQYREHFGAIRDRGLIGLSVGRMAFVDRGHVRLRVLELPFRDGGPKVERMLHALSRSRD